jgi:hypothetical protein
MILWARLANGEVYHAWEKLWRYQYYYGQTYRSLCGQYRKRWQIGGSKMGRKCKGCRMMLKYHNRRPAPVYLNLTGLANLPQKESSE